MGSGQRCAEWLPSKRRLCASWALPGQPFCGNHRVLSGTERRVQCPLDPSHTVLEAEVDAHLKKCPAVKQLQRFDNQAYFRKGLNAGSDDEEEEKEQRRASSKRAAVCELSGNAFKELVRRIDAAFETHCQEPLEDSICQPDACSRWTERDRRLPFQEKHVVQQASILGNLVALGLVDGASTDTTCFVEFGAGRGYLSHMLCDCFEVRKLVMVERRSYKFKADRTLRQQAGVLLERLRIDIEDLDVSGIQTLHGLHYVAMSKHLCGAATDLTLRCCLLGQGGAASADSPVLSGLGIATCCHHLCSWKSYVNKAFFLGLGFSEEDFGFVTWLSSWALSVDSEHGGAEGEGRSKQQTCSASNGLLEAGDSKSWTGKRRLSDALMCVNPDERKDLGFKCKRLIDFGRLQWLKQRGMESKLVRYVPKSVSPENTLLLARRPATEP